MDGALTVNGRNKRRPSHRLLIINVDRHWQFTKLWRRYCFDLFRQRAPMLLAGDSDDGAADPLQCELEVWDVLDGDNRDHKEVERTSVWRHWPKPIIGGPEAAAAEFEDKMTHDLSGGGRQLDQLDHKLVVLVVASAGDLDPREGDRSRVARLLEGFGRHFAETKHQGHRHNVLLLLIVNAGDDLVRRETVLRRLGEPAQENGERFNLAIISDRRLDGHNPLRDERHESNLKLLRLAVDVLAHPGVHENLANQARRNPRSPLVLRLAFKDAQIDTAQQSYADTVYGALHTVDAERGKAHADEQQGTTPFVATIQRRLRESQAVVDTILRRTDHDLFHRRRVEERRDPIKSRLRVGGLTSISRDDNLDGRVQDTFIEFMQDLNGAIREKLGVQAGRLSTFEEESIQQRDALIRGLREGLGLEQLGHGNPGKWNHEESKLLLRRALKDINEQISAFWNELSGENEPKAALTGARALIQQHCPSLDLTWPEVARLADACDEVQSHIARLPFNPSRALWATMCVALFLTVPLLSLGLWAAEPSRELAAWGHSLWGLLFLISLWLPWWLLKRPRQRVLKALGEFNDTSRDLVKEVGEKLKKVTEYLGTIQRHRYLRALDARLDDLKREVDYVDNYLRQVQDSLDPPTASHQSAEPSSDQKSLAALVRQSGSRSIAELNDWLPIALRSFRREERAGVLTVRIIGASSAIPVPSSLIASPLEVTVEEYVEPQGL